MHATLYSSLQQHWLLYYPHSPKCRQQQVNLDSQYSLWRIPYTCGVHLYINSSSSMTLSWLVHSFMAFSCSIFQIKAKISTWNFTKNCCKEFTNKCWHMCNYIHVHMYIKKIIFSRNTVEQLHCCALLCTFTSSCIYICVYLLYILHTQNIDFELSVFL